MKIVTERGMTFTEVIVSLSILSGISLGVANLLKNQSVSNKTAEIQSEYGDVLTEIRNVLADSNSCRETFAGRDASTPSAGNVNSIQYKFDSTMPAKSIFAKGPTKHSLGLVGIEKYSFESSDPTDSTIGFDAGKSTGVINLVVHFYFDKRKKGGAKVNQKIRINVLTNSSSDRRILECAASSTTAVLDLRYLKKTGGQMGGNIIMPENTQIVFESDKKLKYNISEITDQMPKLRRIRPVSYSWIENGDKDFGFLSQDVQKVLPEIVTEEDERLYIDYFRLTPYLISGIKELYVENELMIKKIKQLKERHNLIKDKFCKDHHKELFCKIEH